MSVHIGYAAMCEQFHPTELVQLASYAESRGFTGVMAADHFQPWVSAQGQAPYVWNDRVSLPDVGRNRREWIDIFAREVLPTLTR